MVELGEFVDFWEGWAYRLRVLLLRDVAIN